MIVIKNSNIPQKFDKDKLESSIISTFRIVKSPENSLNYTAKQILKEFEEETKTKKQIHSEEIRNITTKIINKYHKEAAYTYKNFKKIL